MAKGEFDMLYLCTGGRYGKPIVAIFNTIIQFKFNEIQVQFNEIQLQFKFNSISIQRKFNFNSSSIQ